jgi:uncharacterized protein YcsI (UPF0317 family)
MILTELRGSKTPAEVRQAFREGAVSSTSSLCDGYVQVNMAIMPREYAYDFLTFCFRNPKPCPLIEVSDPGVWEPACAKGADVRVDCPKYRVYRDGVLEDEPRDVTGYWRGDLVSFYIGCSFTFEAALIAGGVPVRHIEQGTVVPMYTSNIQCVPAGVFHGPTVVTMRPIPDRMVSRAVQITSRYPGVHGAPLHIGTPERIGVDLDKPGFGGQVSELRQGQGQGQGETPVFWACGVTPQAVALASAIPFMITHAPGYMFITDLLNEDLAAL